MIRCEHGDDCPYRRICASENADCAKSPTTACPQPIARWADPAYAMAQDLARFDRYLDDLTTPPDGASTLMAADKRFFGRTK